MLQLRVFCFVLLLFPVLGQENVTVTIVGPEPFHYSVGDLIRLKCKIFGLYDWQTETAFTWKLHFTDYDGHHSLQLLNFNSSVSSSYLTVNTTDIMIVEKETYIECTARYSMLHPPKSANFSFDVGTEPEITHFESYSRWQHVVVHCMATGKPSPLLQLYRNDNGEMISEAFSDESNNVTSLKLYFWKGKFNSGYYRCEAINVNGHKNETRYLSTNGYVSSTASSWEGTTIYSVPLFDACTTSIQCKRYDDHSSCVNGMCKCDSPYEYSSGMCIKKVYIGDFCMDDWQCRRFIENSFCESHYNGAQCECKPGFKYSDGRCVSEDYYTSPIPYWRTTEKYSVPFGGYCTSNIQCQRKDSLSLCSNDRCACKYPYTYSHYYGRCSSSYYYTTPYPYWRTTEKYSVPFGGYCTSNIQCQRKDSLSLCSNDRCACKYPYTYSHHYGRCSSSYYYTSPIPYWRTTEKYSVPLHGSCTSHVQCERNDGNSSCVYGQCLCNNPYQYYSGRCVKKHIIGDYCTDNFQCQRSIENSFCKYYNGVHICECKRGFLYSHGRCVNARIIVDSTFMRSIAVSCIVLFVLLLISLSYVAYKSIRLACQERKKKQYKQMIEKHGVPTFSHGIPMKNTPAPELKQNEKDNGTLVFLEKSPLALQRSDSVGPMDDLTVCVSENIPFIHDKNNSVC